MELSELVASREDQERGKWFDLLHPVTGAPVGIRFKVVGPDSNTQRNARLEMEDALIGQRGRYEQISAEGREKLVIQMLARCVIDFDVKEAGKPIPFTFLNVVKMIEAAVWVRAQLDNFAADRRPYLSRPNVEADLPVDVDAED